MALSQAVKDKLEGFKAMLKNMHTEVESISDEDFEDDEVGEGEDEPDHSAELDDVSTLAGHIDDAVDKIDDLIAS